MLFALWSCCFVSFRFIQYHQTTLGGPLMKPLFACAVTLIIVAAIISSTAAAPTAILFDDFSYTSKQQLKKNGWILRTEAGWPGVPGATWSEGGVSLHKELPLQFVRMTSSTEGTGATTTQTQICHQRKFFEGTYAARVRFTDAPASG